MKVLVLASAAILGSGVGITNYLNDSIEVDESIGAAREGLIVVRIPGGAITIEGWDRDEVRVTGTVPSGEDRFHLSSDHGHVEIRVIPDLNADPAETNLTIMVPQHSSLDVETDAAAVGVDGVTGVVRMATGSGNITVAGNPLGIVARSQTGDIDIAAQSTPGIAHSEEGTVKLRGGARDFMADRRSRRMENRIQDMECQHRESDDCDHDGRDKRRTQYGRDWKGLGMEIGSMVQDALEDVDIHLDFENYGDGFRFDLSGDIDFDEDKFEDMFEQLEDFFEDFGDEIGDTMLDLSDDLERMGEDLKESHRRSRRSRI